MALHGFLPNSQIKYKSNIQTQKIKWRNLPVFILWHYTLTHVHMQKYKAISVMNINTKFINEILFNPIQQWNITVFVS